MGSHVLSPQGPAPSGEKQEIWRTQKRQKCCGTMNEAKDREVHPKEIQTRARLSLDLWTIHLKSPTATLAKALECLEQGEKVRGFGSFSFCLCLQWDGRLLGRKRGNQRHEESATSLARALLGKFLALSDPRDVLGMGTTAGKQMEHSWCIRTTW